MIRINLIPHREEYRQQQIIEHIIVYVSAILVAVALLGAIDIWKTQDLVQLQGENQTLKSQNKVLVKKIGELRNLDSLRKEVENKLKIVDELQAARFKTFVTLTALAEAMPESVWLKEVSEKGDSLSLRGFGESSQAVANFMRALELQDVFKDVVLQFDNSAKTEGFKVRSFALQFKRAVMSPEEDAKGGGKK